MNNNAQRSKIVATPTTTIPTNPTIVLAIALTPILGIYAMSKPQMTSLHKLINAPIQSPFRSRCGRAAISQMKTKSSTTTLPIVCAHADVGPKTIKADRAMTASARTNQVKWYRGR